MEHIRPPLLHDFPAACNLEWIQTDGVGGVSGSSVLGANTRKQHAVLSVGGGHYDRTVLVASLQETLLVGAQPCELSTNRYRGAVHPAGYLALESFTNEPWPTWHYRFDTAAIEKQLVLVHGEHTAVVTYTLTYGERPATLVVRPLLACRGHNSVLSERGSSPSNWQVTPEFIECRPFDGAPPLFIAHPNAKIATILLWYRDFVYERDAESRVECTEDLLHPGYIELELSPGTPTSLVFSSPSPRSLSLAGEYVERERKRRRSVACSLSAGRDPLFEALLLAADAFVYERRQGKPGIFPGLPWGESEMYRGLIAMPGLLLVPRRFDVARGYLSDVGETWMRAQSLADFEPETVMGQMYAADVPLWVFIAAWRYWQATQDRAFVAEVLLPLLKDIAGYYLDGGEVCYTQDGLIEVARQPGVEHDPVMPLSTNALWYNAQMILAELMTAAKAPGADLWRERAQRTFAGLGRTFACEGRPGLAESVRAVASRRDEALRASQVLAVGLPFCAVEDPRPIVGLIAEHLATPYGLRTLSPRDSRYVGDGLDVKVLPKFWSGSIDPTWFGCYCDALKRVARPLGAGEIFAPFETELRQRGCGHISGAFAGEAPHEPCHYAASASGLAEVLRIHAREVARLAHIP